MSFQRLSSVSTSAAIVAFVAGHAMGQVTGAVPIALTARTDALGPNQGAATFVHLNNAGPSINSAGQVVFRAQNSVMPINGDTSLAGLALGTGGVYVWTGGVNSIRAQIGDPTPDASTYLFGSVGGGFTNSLIAADGTISYGNAQTGASASTGAYFVQSPGAALINRMATLAPGAGGATFSLSSAGTLGMATNGGYILTGSLAGTGVISTTGDANRNDSAVWTGSGGSLSMLYRRNMALDGLAGGVKPDGSPTSFAGVRMGDFSFSSTGAYNANGHYIWRGQNLQGSVNTTSNSPSNNAAAIFSNVSGSLQALARSGNMAAGTLPADNTTYGGFSTVAINNQDRYAFSVGLRVGTATTTTSTLYSNHVNGSLQMLARQGTAVPASLNFPAGTLWGSSSSALTMSGGNYLVWNTLTLTGPTITTSTNNALVMCGPDGSYTNIARTRTEPAPAISPVLGETAMFTSFGGWDVNALGQVAFVANVVGSLTTGSGIVANQNNFALFAYDQFGETFLIAQTGTAFEVAPGDVRTVAQNVSGTTFGSIISTTLGSGGEDGRGTSLSDTGLLTFGLRFTDGTSGVFVRQIPSPGATALLGAAGLLAARRRRR